METSDAIAVTGMGAVCALGHGCSALWQGVEAGRDGITSIRRFSTEELSVHLAALVPEHNTPIEGDEGAAAHALCVELACRAGREALAAGSITRIQLERSRVALVLGSSITDASRSIHELADEVGAALGVHGPRIAVSTACASSTNAVGLARDLIVSGDCDLAIAGGIDVLTRLLFSGFHALGVLSAKKCAPFSTDMGTTLGEGAGFVVLEHLSDACRRGIEARALVFGYGLSGDAYHETSPEPTGAGVARALRGALRDARLEPTEIGYANVHGTGTEANDLAEARGYRKVFGDSLARLPMSASKSILGHAQAAAGILELIIALEAMRRQVVPPTLHFTEARPGAPEDVVAGCRPRPHIYDAAMKTSAAFGGANAALVVVRPGTALSRRKRATPRRDVWLRGVGLADDAPGSQADLGKLVRTVDARKLDTSSRLLTLAAARALRDGKVSVRGSLCGRAGLIVGATRPSRESAARFEESTRDRSITNLSVAAFARLLLHATTGSCSMALSLQGPSSTITTGPGSGLTALAYATNLLATRSDVDVIIAGAVDERAEPETEEERGQGAAAAVLLSTEPPQDGMAIRIAGWALGPSESRDATASTALDRAGLSRKNVRVCTATSSIHLQASGELFALVDCVMALRRAEIDHAVVITSKGTTTTAVVATRGNRHES